MALSMKDFRILAFAVLLITSACNKDVNVAPTPPKLPACGQNVISGYTDKTSYFPGEEVEVFLQSKTSLSCGLGLYSISGQLVFTSDVLLFPQSVSTYSPWLNGFDFSINGKVSLPASLASGVYFFENRIPVIIKSSGASDVVVVYPSNTINAYNSNGGKSLYSFNSSNNTPSTAVSIFEANCDNAQMDLCIECLKWFPSLSEVSFGYICDMDLDTYSSIANSKLVIDRWS
ncbi:MAG: hypothetical protein QM734_02095 [Cyclobacteriaceae bacterium]